MFDLNITSSVNGDRTGGRAKNSIFSSPSLTIIVLCILSFILEQIPIIGPQYISIFQFDPNSLILRPWTLVTYIFLHTGLWHLFFNMFVLFFFGPALEKRIGNKMFLEVFFTAGVLSALGFAFLSKPIFDISPGLMVGASGAIYGVFAALTVLEPDLLVYVYFVPMKLKYALLLFALFDILMVNFPDTIAHTAHLSGLFIGLYMGLRIKKAQEKYIKTYGRW